jgi:hypothetical protein
MLIRPTSLVNTSVLSTCVANTLALILCIDILVSIVKVLNPSCSRNLV